MDPISKEQASRLWDELKGNLLAVEDGIKQIIATKAWEPLGYESFAEAWEDRLHGVKISKELRATVVYAMLDDGASPGEISRAVEGVGPSTVTSLTDARAAGIEVTDAAYLAFRRRPTPSASRPPKTIAITLSFEEHAALKAAADAQGIAVKACARSLLMLSLGVNLQSAA